MEATLRTKRVQTKLKIYYKEFHHSILALITRGKGVTKLDKKELLISGCFMYPRSTFHKDKNPYENMKRTIKHEKI